MRQCSLNLNLSSCQHVGSAIQVPNPSWMAIRDAIVCSVQGNNLCTYCQLGDRNKQACNQKDIVLKRYCSKQHGV